MEGLQVTQAARALLLAGALAACQPNDPTKRPPPTFRLEGSLGTVLDITYDTAVVEPSVEALAVRFVRARAKETPPSDGGMDTVAGADDVNFQLTYALLGADYPMNARVDMTERVNPNDAMSAQRGLASRNVLNDPRKKLPLLVRGSLTLKGALTDGATVEGDLNVTFENGTDVASGRTVFGHFNARVRQ